MAVVLYSMLSDSDGRYERQWARSLTSLRRHNPDAHVLTCAYGAPTPSMAALARELRVELIDMGDYADVFADLPAPYAAALNRNRTLHKLASLRRVSQALPRDAVLYLDSDTYVLGDVGSLAERSERVDWIAREEPGSRRSAGGYDAAWVDEDLLRAVQASEGLLRVPPYNMGVFAISPTLARAVAALLDEYLWYTWRLLAGAVLHRPSAFVDSDHLDAVRRSVGGYDARLTLPYPAGDIWIVDEVAAWLLLGRLPGATLATFTPHEVAQSNEYLAPDLRPVLIHYFTAHAQEFEAYLDQFGAAQAGAR
jgi:hypothetical protein